MKLTILCSYNSKTLGEEGLRFRCSQTQIKKDMKIQKDRFTNLAINIISKIPFLLGPISLNPRLQKTAHIRWTGVTLQIRIGSFFVHKKRGVTPHLTLFPRGCRFPSLPGGGGIWYPPIEIKEGVVLGPMLLKVILKPIKVMITCKILDPYLKNSSRYRDLKNLSFWDFVLPRLTEIAKTRSIFEIESSSFKFSLSFTCFKIHVWELTFYDQFCNDLNFYTLCLCAIINPLQGGGM